MKSNLPRSTLLHDSAACTALVRCATTAVAASLVVLLAVSLTACGSSKDKAPSQSLAQVNGSDITVLQMNEELARSKVSPNQKEAATKQLLEGLIDRQLLQNEALRDKVDRDPQVVQAIERAKSQILTQAYLQKRVANIDKPSKADIEAYYDAHPEIFAQSKTYAMHEIIIATADVNAEANALIAKAASLEEVTVWMQSHKIQFTNNQLTRSATDLPSSLLKKLQGMSKGQLFTATEGDRTIVVELFDLRDNPVTFDAAAAQIGQYLMNEKNKAAAEAEVARLRANAKIVYLNQAGNTEVADKAVDKAVDKADNKSVDKSATAIAQTAPANAPTPAAPAAPAVSTPIAAPITAVTAVQKSGAVTGAEAGAVAATPVVTEDQIKRGVAGLR